MLQIERNVHNNLNNLSIYLSHYTSIRRRKYARSRETEKPNLKRARERERENDPMLFERKNSNHNTQRKEIIIMVIYIYISPKSLRNQKTQKNVKRWREKVTQREMSEVLSLGQERRSFVLF